MSTKTSIKRIALVAAAALALGGFSAVSASAADNATLKFATGDGAASAPYNTGTGAAGIGNEVTVTLNQLAGKDAYVTITGGTIGSVDTTTAVLATDGTYLTRAAAYAGAATLHIATPKVGTITLNLYTRTSGTSVYTQTAAETVTITVNAASQSGIYSAAKSTVFLAAGETSTAVSTDAVVSVLSTAASSTDSGTAAAATVQVLYLDGLGAVMPNESITATISSGPGTIATTTRLTGSDTTTAINAKTGNASNGIIFNVANQYSASTNLSNGVANFVIYPNGQSGVSTIVVKNAAGTVIGTKTVTFTGTTVASMTASLKKAFVQGDTAAETTAVVAINLKDASGNVMVGKAYAPTVTYSIGSKTVSATPDTGTADADGNIWYGFTPGAAATYGTVTATFTDPTTSTITQSVTFTLSSAVAASLVIAAPASVNAGDAITYTVTAKDANGYAVPDGSAVVRYVDSTTGSTTASAGIGSFGWSGVTAAGVAKITSSGAIVATNSATVTFTLTGSTAGVASTYLAKALSATTPAVTFAVVGADGGSSSLAYDAASAATDAANNAYEEAQNATQAASDALAAVKALAVQVKALIALVNKIKAKLKA